jgi:hypothetical protein
MMATRPGSTKKHAGDDAAEGAVQQPADIDAQLLGLGAGQQHAEVERMQEALFADPALLLDQDAVHDRDLAGRAAEAQHGDAGPRGGGFGQRRERWPPAHLSSTSMKA